MSTPFGSWRDEKPSAEGKPGRTPKRRGGRPAARFRHVTLEPLELRELLSGNTYQVTDTSDTANSTTTLRAAIADANIDTGTATDTIQLGAGTFDLTQALGALDIASTDHALIIDGNGSSGPGATIIDQTFADRVFEVGEGVTVTFENLEITGGTAIDDGGGSSEEVLGGGILNFGTVTLDDLLVTNNMARAGTGNFALGGGIYSTGSLTIDNSTIEDNIAKGGAAAGGGLASSGTLSINDSQINENTVVGSQSTSVSEAGVFDALGAGIYSESTDAVSITGSQINDNGAQASNGQDGTGAAAPGGDAFGAVGGGMYIDLESGSPTALISGNTLAGNLATGGTGGTGGPAPSSLESGGSTVGGTGGTGGYAYGGGIVVAGSGSATISDNTLSDNTAQAGAGGAPGANATSGVGGVACGGGIFVGAVTDLFQDTIVGNSALGGSGSTSGDGSGGGVEDDSIVSGGSGLFVLSCTITGNQATAGTPTTGGTAGSSGGGGIDDSGVFLGSADTGLLMANNIVAGNTAGSGTDVDGAVAQTDDNLIGNGTGATGFSVAYGDLVGTQAAPINPLLGSLANNGGLNQTISLLPGSPALGMGDPSMDTNNGLTTDARGAGYARVVGGVINLGATQTQITPVLAPSVTGASTTESQQSTSGLVITPSSSGTQYFQITDITGGTLYQHDGLTPINDGDFITLAEAAAGLRFTPTSGSLTPGSFAVQESTTNIVGGLDGSITTAAIGVAFSGPSVTTTMTAPSTQSTSGLVITPGLLDTAAYFEITGISGGSLYLADGVTQVTNGQFITVAQGEAGLKFTPTTNSAGGSFSAEESASSATAGLSGPSAMATITVSGSSQSVGLSHYFNRTGITNDGAGFAGGLDGQGNALSEQQVGSSITWNGLAFSIGPAGQNDVVAAQGQSISLSGGSLSTIEILATGVNGNQPNQVFTVNYTDGSSQTFTRSISDWNAPQGYAGESVALSTAHRNKSSGAADNRTFDVYGYVLNVNPNKTIANISLPNDSNLNILAIDAVAPVAGAPSLTALAISSSQVNLSWTAPTSGGTITGYNVFRGTISGGESLTPLNSTPLSATATNYTDHAVVAGNTYYYEVVPIDAAATGITSNEASATVATTGLTSEIDLNGDYNFAGIVAAGTKISGGLDGAGNDLAVSQLGSSQTYAGTTFSIAPVGANNVIQAVGQTIGLPAVSYSQLELLATSVDGNQIAQQFVIHYTDGSSQPVFQSMSDWASPQGYAGESTAVTMAFRSTANGGISNQPFYAYEYSLPVDSSKTIQSITLPNNSHVDVLAISGVAPVSAPTALSASQVGNNVQLSWTASAGTITGYDVFRGTVAGGESLTPLNSTPLPPGTTTFQDTTTVPGNTYFYVVKAINGPGFSSPTNEFSITTAISSNYTQVDLSGAYNQVGLTTDGTHVSGGIDGSGNTLSANALQTVESQVITPAIAFPGQSSNSLFVVGPTGSNNVVVAAGQTIGLPNGNFSSVQFLAIGVNGNQPSQTFTVHYSDGSSQTFTQSISDWHAPQGYTGESVAAAMSYRNTAGGGRDNQSFNIYSYSLPVDNTRTIVSITLPTDSNVKLLAISAVQ